MKSRPPEIVGPIDCSTGVVFGYRCGIKTFALSAPALAKEYG